MADSFSDNIQDILRSLFKKHAEAIFSDSYLLQYLEKKTRSANLGSKSRSNYGNLYALYVVVSDYLEHGFDKRQDYSTAYAGARQTELLNHQRSLPFGEKLQNHGLNHRMNEEFKKFFPLCSSVPISHDLQTKRYWINENLLLVKIGTRKFNLAPAIIRIIDEYITTKRDALTRFIAQCEELKKLPKVDNASALPFIQGLLAPNVDARLFEIVSYSILKYFYRDTRIYWGFDRVSLFEDSLQLFKTGRTNANDGGIDFVMRPLGRFFQVTESVDMRKYFLDIDKVARYPISFVIKSEDPVEALIQKLRSIAMIQFDVESVVNTYMACIEELINLPLLRERLNTAVAQGYLPSILNEIIEQSKVEFNFQLPE